MNPRAAYDQLCRDGTITPDDAQRAVLDALDGLHQQLSKQQTSWFGRLGKKTSPPRGIYIYGDVGRGKSMIMDLFFRHAPVAKKKRVHFHAFMQSLHKSLYNTRQQNDQTTDNVLLQFAKTTAQEARLLCFDEFHVVDVADAMLLGRLFQALWDLGVVVVATSNWPPDLLYKDGLQRSRFLPFIAELKNNMQICHLQSQRDYRLARLNGRQVYFFPLGLHASECMEALFAEVTEGAEITAIELQLSGRRWLIRRTAKGAAWLDFNDVCGSARGAPDYLALANEFQAIFLDCVPIFTDDMRNEVKRFMTLIDVLYEHRCRVIITAEAAPHALYPTGHHGFEFERTVSRLMEMQASDYPSAIAGEAA